MIRSERGTVKISGTIGECLAEYGMLTKHFIISVPEEIRLHLMMDITKTFETAIMEEMKKGGEENEEP